MPRHPLPHSQHERSYTWYIPAQVNGAKHLYCSYFYLLEWHFYTVAKEFDMAGTILLTLALVCAAAFTASLVAASVLCVVFIVCFIREELLR